MFVVVYVTAKTQFGFANLSILVIGVITVVVARAKLTTGQLDWAGVCLKGIVLQVHGTGQRQGQSKRVERSQCGILIPNLSLVRTWPSGKTLT